MRYIGLSRFIRRDLIKHLYKFYILDDVALTFFSAKYSFLLMSFFYKHTIYKHTIIKI